MTSIRQAVALFATGVEDPQSAIQSGSGSALVHLPCLLRQTSLTANDCGRYRLVLHAATLPYGSWFDRPAC
jgi:hypothetical protein